MEPVYSDHDDEDSLKSSNAMEKAFDGLLKEIADDVFSDLCFDIHRAVKLGYYSEHEYVVREGRFDMYDPVRDGFNVKPDVLGNFKGYQTVIPCPVCKIGIHSSRFAPHLKCCMGNGRKKRDASKRFKGMFESDHDDDENGSDDCSSRKRKEGKSTQRRVRRGQQGDYFSGSSTSSEANFREMTTDFSGSSTASEANFREMTTDFSGSSTSSEANFREMTTDFSGSSTASEANFREMTTDFSGSSTSSEANFREMTTDFSGSSTASEANFREMTTDFSGSSTSSEANFREMTTDFSGSSTSSEANFREMTTDFSGSSTSSEANFREMTTDSIRECLSQMCGVISEPTGRFCRNALNCSMHDVEQRREVRGLFLGSAVEPPLADDVQIDVDTVDEDSIVPLGYTNQQAPRSNSSHAETDAGPNTSRRIGSRQEDFPSTSGHGSYY